MMANLPKQGQTTWTKRQSQTWETSHHRRCELVYVEELTTTRAVRLRHSVFSRCSFRFPHRFSVFVFCLFFAYYHHKGDLSLLGTFSHLSFSLFSSTAIRAVSFRPIFILDCVFNQSSGNIFSCCPTASNRLLKSQLLKLKWVELSGVYSS